MVFSTTLIVNIKLIFYNLGNILIIKKKNFKEILQDFHLVGFRKTANLNGTQHWLLILLEN